MGLICLSISIDPCVKRWLAGLAESTGENRLPLVDGFFEFVGISASEAVEFQRLHPNDYRFVDSLYEWLEGNGNLMVSSMEVRASTVRGFFLSNRAPMPRDKHTFHSDKEPVLGELTVDEFRKILLSCNKDKRAAYLVQFQSGSGVKELRYINVHHADYVWDEVRKGARIIRLAMPGRKAYRNIRPYYTFIGSDAIDALRDLFHSRGWKRDTVLFRTEFGNPVTGGSLQTYFREHAIKLDIIKRHTPPCLECGGETVKRKRKVKQKGKKPKNTVFYLCTVCQVEHKASDYKIAHTKRGGVRYRMRTHELRDVFSTEWHRAATYFGVAPWAGEFFMGHGIDPLKYNKIMKDGSYGLEQYRKALPMLDILSQDPRKVDRSDVQNQLEASEAKVNTLTRRIVDLERRQKRYDEVLGRPETIEWLESLGKKKK